MLQLHLYRSAVLRIPFASSEHLGSLHYILDLSTIQINGRKPLQILWLDNSLCTEKGTPNMLTRFS